MTALCEKYRTAIILSWPFRHSFGPQILVEHHLLLCVERGMDFMQNFRLGKYIISCLILFQAPLCCIKLFLFLARYVVSKISTRHWTNWKPEIPIHFTTVTKLSRWQRNGRHLTLEWEARLLHHHNLCHRRQKLQRSGKSLISYYLLHCMAYKNLSAEHDACRAIL